MRAAVAVCSTYSTTDGILLDGKIHTSTTEGTCRPSQPITHASRTIDAEIVAQKDTPPRHASRFAPLSFAWTEPNLAPSTGG